MAAHAGYQCLSPSHRHRDTMALSVGKRSFRSRRESDFISRRDHEKFALLCHASRDDFHFRENSPSPDPPARTGQRSLRGRKKEQADKSTRRRLDDVPPSRPAESAKSSAITPAREIARYRAGDRFGLASNAVAS